MFSIHCSSTVKASSKTSSSCVEVGVVAVMGGLVTIAGEDLFRLLLLVLSTQASATWQ